MLNFNPKSGVNGPYRIFQSDLLPGAFSHLPNIELVTKKFTAVHSSGAASLAPPKPLQLSAKEPVINSVDQTIGSIGKYYLSLVKVPTLFALQHSLSMVSYGMLKGGQPSEKDRRIDEEVIHKLTGSSHLARAFNAISPCLAVHLLELVKGFELGEFFGGFLSNKSASFEEIIKTLLPKIFLNISKNSKERLALGKAQKTETFTLTDAIASLTAVFQSHSTIIALKIAQIETLSDPVRRQENIRQLFSPLSIELLSIMLPHGIDELPLVRIPIISERYWSNFKNIYLPDILYALYRQFALPFPDETLAELSASEGGDFFVKIAKAAPKQAEEFLSTLCKKPEGAVVGVYSSFVTNAANSCSALFSGPPALNRNLTNWLCQEFERLGTSKNPHIQLIWNVLASYAEPTLLHIFSHMTKAPIGSTNNPDALCMTSIKLCALFNSFYNVNSNAIDARTEELQEEGRAPELDARLLELFSPLAEELFLLIGLDDHKSLPIPEFIQEPLMAMVKRLLPEFLIQQTVNFKKMSFQNEASHKKFRSLLFDSRYLKDPAIATSIMISLHETTDDQSGEMSDLFHQKLWEKSGTEALATTLEGCCSVLVTDIVSFVLKYCGISNQRALQEDNNPFMKQMISFMKSSIETVLLNSVVHLVEKTPNTIPVKHKEHPITLFAFELFKRLSELSVHGLKNIQDKTAEVNKKYEKGSARHTLEMRKLFLNLASDLHALIGPNPLKSLPFDGLPGWEGGKTQLWESIKTTLLPDFLYKNHQQILAWSKQKEREFEVLDACYRTTHPAAACTLIAQYASDYIQHYLVTSGDEAASLILDAVRSFFTNHSENRAKQLAELFGKKSDLIQDVLSKNIIALGRSLDGNVCELWPFLTIYIEAILAKCFANISSEIATIEAGHPDFMIDAAVKMLEATSEYFNILNEQAEKHGQSHLYTIDPAMMLAGFGTKLHDGVPLDPSADSQENNQVRLRGLLMPLAKKLMQLATIKSGDLPLPDVLSDSLGELLIETLLPRILLSIDQTILEPNVRDVLILNFIKMLYTALNGLDDSHEKSVPDVDSVGIDPRRKLLNESCGGVVLEIVKLIPDTMVQYVFMKEKVKNMSAEAIGDAIMAYLSKWTLIQLIDTIIVSVLPSLHSAKWEGKVGRETLVPRRVVMQADGKPALLPVKNFKFTFPKTPKEVSEENQKRLSEARKVRQELQDGFTKTISSQVFVNAWNLIKKLWNDLQVDVDVYITKKFPDKGPKVKAYLDSVFHKFFFDLLGPIVQFCSYPFVQLIKFVTEKILIDKKSEDIINTLHSPTVEHLFNTWIDIVFDTLLKFSQSDKNSHSSSAETNLSRMSLLKWQEQMKAPK